MSTAESGLTLTERIYIPGNGFSEAEYSPTAADYLHMDEALNQARIAGEARDNPIGCVYVSPTGEATAAQTRELRDQDLEGHAEKIGYKHIQPEAGRDLSDWSLYTMSEPCFGCAYLLDKGRLGRLFVAARKADAPDFFRNSDTLDHIWQTTRRDLRVVFGLRRVEALDILTTYDKRH